MPIRAYLVHADVTMVDETTRWTINVDARTDNDLRGMKNGGPSKFIDEAAKWRLLDLAVSEAREAFADSDPDELANLIGEVVAAAQTH